MFLTKDNFKLTLKEDKQLFFALTKCTQENVHSFVTLERIMFSNNYNLI